MASLQHLNRFRKGIAQPQGSSLLPLVTRHCVRNTSFAVFLQKRPAVLSYIVRELSNLENGQPLVFATVGEVHSCCRSGRPASRKVLEQPIFENDLLLLHSIAHPQPRHCYILPCSNSVLLRGPASSSFPACTRLHLPVGAWVKCFQPLYAVREQPLLSFEPVSKAVCCAF